MSYSLVCMNYIYSHFDYIEFSANNAFLESPSSGTIKDDIFESQIIVGNTTTKGHNRIATNNLSIGLFVLLFL